MVPCKTMMASVQLGALACLLAVTAGSCQPDYGKMSQEFIARHRDESFAEFRGVNVFIRDRDPEGELIIFFFSEEIDSLCGAKNFMIIAHTADSGSKIESLDYKELRNNCRGKIDKETVKLMRVNSGNSRVGA